MTPPGRNDPCPCGSDKKYKKWCLPAKETAAALVSQAKMDAANEAAQARKIEQRALWAQRTQDFEDHQEHLILTNEFNEITVVVRAGGN